MEDIVSGILYHVLGDICAVGVAYCVWFLLRLWQSEERPKLVVIGVNGVLCVVLAYAMLFFWLSREGSFAYSDFWENLPYMPRLYICSVASSLLIAALALGAWPLLRDKREVQGILAVASGINLYIIGQPVFYLWLASLTKLV
jgi:hypothetical protein